MKTKTLVFLSLLFCSTIHAQDIDITGTWTMCGMTWTNGQDITKTTDDQLKAQGAVTDYVLMPEGKMKLTSNMTGSGKLDTFEGTWKLDGKKLIIGLTRDGNPVDIAWDFDFQDGIMILKRSSPNGSSSVENNFKRKESN